MTIAETNEINVKVESAIRDILLPHLPTTEVRDNVFLSDYDSEKSPPPFIVIHSEPWEEQITPGSGIYKIPVDITFKSGAVDTPSVDRREVIAGINNCVYGGMAAALSNVTAFHCHGVIPAGGGLELDPENFIYIFTIRLEVICMPRDNA